MRVLLLASPMVTRFTRNFRWLRTTVPVLSAGVILMALASACDKVPLLAPSSSVITICPATTTVSLNTEIEIVATVIENGTTSTQTPGTPTNGTPTTPTTTSSPGAGTPVQNGTLVS